MGIHLCLLDKNDRDHLDWDCFRHAGDRDIATLVPSLPCERSPRSVAPDWEPYYRPSDFAVWRAAAAAREWPNPGRFEKLIDIMEKSPDCWLYISY